MDFQIPSVLTEAWASLVKVKWCSFVSSVAESVLVNQTSKQTTVANKYASYHMAVEISIERKYE